MGDNGQVRLRVRNKGLRRVRVADLEDAPWNFRTHPPMQRGALEGAINELGYYGYPDVYETAGGTLRLTDGHLRKDLLIAKYGPDTEIDVNETDFDDEDAKKAILTKDPLAAMAEADTGKLDELLRQVQTGDENLAAMLEQLAEAHGILDGLAQSDIVEDEVPEPQAVVVTKPSDLWILGEHRLLCGDCRKEAAWERLLMGKRAHMMFTDPPYGVNYEGGHFHSGDVDIKREREKLHADDSTAIYAEFLPVAMRFVDGPCYMWFADSRGLDVYSAVDAAGCEIHALIIWHKINATYAAMNAQYKQRHEPCLYFKPKGSTLRWCGPTDECTLWELAKDGRNDLHPTQKPISLAARAITNHEAETVADVFAGSGSTIMACEALGCRCMAIEIEPCYVDVSIRRWQNLTGRQAILESTGQPFPSN